MFAAAVGLFAVITLVLLLAGAFWRIGEMQRQFFWTRKIAQRTVDLLIWAERRAGARQKQTIEQVLGQWQIAIFNTSLFLATIITAAWAAIFFSLAITNLAALAIAMWLITVELLGALLRGLAAVCLALRGYGLGPDDDGGGPERERPDNNGPRGGLKLEFDFLADSAPWSGPRGQRRPRSPRRQRCPQRTRTPA